MAISQSSNVTLPAADGQPLNSQSRFEALFEQSPTSMQILASDGRTVQVNKAWRALWEAPGEKSLSDFVLYGDYNVLTDPQLRAKGITPYLEHAFAGESVRIPAALYDPAELGKPGRPRWVTAIAHPIKDREGRVQEVMLMHEDITHQIEAERSLRDSEARFRTIIEAMPQIVWSTRPDGYHEYYNQRWYDFTGVAVGTTDGLEWERLVHPDDRERTWKSWRHSLATGEPYEIQYRLRHYSGRYRWALGRALPVRDDTGEIVRWFGTCTDIHDQKLSEDAWREAARQKDDFLAMLAHELRNPLAPISAAAQMMELAQLDQEHIKQTSRIINRQVQHLIALVDDLLDVSRVTRGLVLIDKSPHDLKLIATSAVEQVTPLLQAKRQTLNLTLPSEAAPILGDEKRLVQVITNLLNNSVKYTPEGGSIKLTVEVRGSKIMLRVEDNGNGIAPAFQPQVFDLFTQAARSADRAQGGLGLGLTLVKSIVNLHGGEVSCNSAGIGKGSEFTVVLPCLQKEPVLQDKESLSQVVRTERPLKIVIVDDNMDAAAMLAKYLQIIGHQVQVEISSLNALAKVTTTVPDVCILDIGLPEMDGYELASRLRAHSATSHVKLIAVTGYGQEQDRKKSTNAGFDHHMVKPVDAAKLVSLLSKLA